MIDDLSQIKLKVLYCQLECLVNDFDGEVKLNALA